MSKRRLETHHLVNLLFQTIRKADGTPYNTLEVSLLIGMTDSTLRTLRSGDIVSPKLDTVIPVARFFNVSLDYFEASSEEEALGIIARSRGTLPKLQHWAFRIGQLPDSAQEDLFRMVEWMEKAEALRLRKANSSS